MLDGGFCAPAQSVFADCDKRGQKHRKEPEVPSPPGALYRYILCKPVTACHLFTQGVLFRLAEGIVSALLRTVLTGALAALLVGGEVGIAPCKKVQALLVYFKTDTRSGSC